LVSSAYIGGLPSSGTSVGEKIAVGGAGGVLMLWEKGVWDDQDERIYVERGARGGEALDSLAVAPDDFRLGKIVVVGQADGKISFVKIGPNKVVARAVHDELEGVIGLGFDVEGRLISGGGQVVKVWHEADHSDTSSRVHGRSGKHTVDSDSGADDNSIDNGSSDDSDNKKDDKKRRKKRKRVKGKDLSGGHHVMAFADLD